MSWLILACICLLASSMAVANNCVSLATGNWSVAATWNSCGGLTPRDGDNVTIASGHTVTLDIPTENIASLTLNSGATLTGTGGKDIYVGGNIVNNGVLNVAAGGNTNTIFLVGAGVTSTWSGTGVWNLDNADLNGGTGARACTGTCKLEVSGTPTLNFANNAIFAGNSATKLFNSNNNAAFTVNLNRAGNQSIKTDGTIYPNLVLSGSGTRTPTAGTLTVLGNVTVSAGITLNANGNDPTINISGGLSVAGIYTASTNAARPLTISGAFSNTGTFTGNASPVNLAGNFSNSGSFTSGAGTWTFNGGSAQTITSGTPSFQNMVVNGSGVTLSSGSVTVSTLLTLTSGNITTGANSMLLSAACPGSISRVGGFVGGNLRLTFPAAATTCTFHVGAGSYTPIVVTNTGAGTLTASTTAADLPPTAASGINPALDVNRYWTLWASGDSIASTSYSPTFNFVASDIDAGANTASFIVGTLVGSSWSNPTLGTRSGTSTQATGIGGGITAQTRFVVGNAGVSASVSTVAASPTTVIADNTTTSTITVTLKDPAGNPVSGKTVTLAAGSGSSTISAASGASNASGVVTFTVKDSVAETVTYTATDATDSIVITQTASVAFTPAITSFNVVETGANAVTGKLFTKIAGQNFAFDIVALDASNNVVTTFTGTVLVEIVDNSSGTCAAASTIASFGNQLFTGANAGRHPLTAGKTVADVYPNAKVRIKYPTSSPTITSCSTDSFAIRPASLSFLVQDANRTTAGTTNTLNNTAIAGSTVHNAGRPFTITATAYNGAGTPVITSNYNGTPTAVQSVCGGIACTATTGTLSLGTWSTSGGTVTTTTASYDDVGAFNLQLQDATYATASSGDGSDGTPAAQYTISSTATGLGRFVPESFQLSATSITPRSDVAACSGSSFTYMGERMDANFTLTAIKYPSGTTARYTGTLARLVLTTPASFSFGAIDSTASTALTSRLDTSFGSSSTLGWVNGVATVAAVVSINRNATPDGPYSSFKLGIAPSDPDSVALDPAALNLDADNSGSNERGQIGSATGVRFGRLRLQNANGSQLLAMPVPIQVQYWNGSGFITNTLDNCTPLLAANIALGNYQKNLSSGETTVTVSSPISAGVGTLRLSAPGSGNNGSVDVSVNLTAGTAGASCTAGMPASTATSKTYLQGLWCTPPGIYTSDPTARATFGVNRGSDQFIYQRENY